MAEPRNSGSIAQALEVHRQRHGELEKEVAGIAERLADMKQAYKESVEAAEDDTVLDQCDEEISLTERAVTRSRIRLQQVKNEIANLEQEKSAALGAEQEARFMKAFEELCDKFIMFEMSLTEFTARKAAIEDVIRSFMNEAVKSGRDIHRLKISDNIRRQLFERLYPSYLSKSNRSTFGRPMADILEEHCRVILGIPLVPSGKATQAKDVPQAGPSASKEAETTLSPPERISHHEQYRKKCEQ